MKKVIAVVSCLLVAATAYAEKPKAVTVVNAPDVNVANMPDVNVVNSPEVNVANVPDVLVVNEAPIPVAIQDGAQIIVEWRYIGLTTHEDEGIWSFEGLYGIAAMNKACASDYGPGARAANIAEAYFRDYLQTETRTGWLVPGGPILVAEYIGQPSDPFRAVDGQTGVTVGYSKEDSLRAASAAYCGRYLTGDQASGDYARGPVSNPYGKVVTAWCDYSRPAACSAPVAIPVTP